MDLIIKYAAQSMPYVHNYIGNLIVLKIEMVMVCDQLFDFGLLTMPAEYLSLSEETNPECVNTVRLR